MPDLIDAPLPGRDCPLCPRLAAFRDEARAAHPDWHNAPVPSFGDLSARLLVVGLAPGLRGANRTGRPFTGDWAGDLLYETLIDFGFASGVYDERPDDGVFPVDGLTFWERAAAALRSAPAAAAPAVSTAAAGASQHEWALYYAQQMG